MNIEAIAAAETVLGVTYTQAERAMMVEDLAAQTALARRRRAIILPHDLPPATRFDPRLPGWTAPPQSDTPLRLDPPGPLPDHDDDIAYAPVTRLAGWIRAGTISSERLTRLYLDRIARHASALECMATVTADLALAQARHCDERLASGTYLGPLHGIPWGCKDLFDTAGIVTAWGAEPWADRIPQTDATVVQRLAASGAVLIAKTTLGALAYGDIWHGGVTRNPWNIEEGSSGSSAGSAAATAAGLVGFSLGTETLGSIVAPSYRCGTTGLRPTFGRVPRTGAMPLCWSLDKIGPICRSVADTALVLAAINGADGTDPSAIDQSFGVDLSAPVRGLRLGYYPADLDDEAAQPLDRAMLDEARTVGLTLVPLTRPDLPYDTLMSLLTAEAAASFERLTLDDEDDRLTWQDPAAWPNTFRRARFLSAVDHVQLDRLRRRVMQVMDEAFATVDAIIGPALTGPMLLITNFTGHPCLALPVGFRQSPTRRRVAIAKSGLDHGDASAGPQHTVPHAISLYGRLFDEATILRIGAAFEARLGFAGTRPPLS